jgi:beta-glucosidase
MLEKTAGTEIEGAIDEFLSQMTIQEKVGQMCLSWAWDSYKRTGNGIILNDDFTSLISKKHIGATYGIYRADPWTKISPKNGPDPIEGVKIMNMLQKYNMENSRLKIPILFGESAEHGKLGKFSMLYPTGLMVGCTFNPDLAYEMYKAMAIETYSTGARVVYSPILDLALDPRWGRVEETFGEDPYLAGLLGQLYVKAFQGDSIDANSILITLKHFVHALPEGGHNAGTASIGERELRSKFLKPFEMAVKQGAGSVMSSYNTIDGVPCSMSKWLLTDVLRDDWGFNGFVISDAASVIEINGRHGVSDNNEEIAGLAVNAGLDMEMGADVFMEHLIKAVENKFIPMENIDLAVRRILRQKFLLGLFDKPYVDETLAEQNINRKDFRELNRQVAREGIVLLENKNKTLPLSRDLNSIAVIGPNANKSGNQLGSYTYMYQRDEDILTVLEGIKNEVDVNTEVHYARGCGIKDLDNSDFTNAITISRKSDLVVLVIGF